MCIEYTRANAGSRYGRNSIDAKSEAGFAPASPEGSRVRLRDHPGSGEGGVRIIGVDPGQEGGWAAITETGVCAEPLPFIGKVLDVGSLVSRWTALSPDVVVIERAQAYPKQGSSSAFNYGETYGLLKGIVRTLGFRMELVGPAKWHAALLIGKISDPKAKKDAVIRYVYEAFPSVSLVRPGCRKPHDVCADALCLAEFGARTYGRAAA